jgi:hypothetical protein
MDQDQKLTLAPTECLHAMLQSAVFLVTVACDVQHTYAADEEAAGKRVGSRQRGRIQTSVKRQDPAHEKNLMPV